MCERCQTSGGLRRTRAVGAPPDAGRGTWSQAQQWTGMVMANRMCIARARDRTERPPTSMQITDGFMVQQAASLVNRWLGVQVPSPALTRMRRSGYVSGSRIRINRGVCRAVSRPVRRNDRHESARRPSDRVGPRHDATHSALKGEFKPWPPKIAESCLRGSIAANPNRALFRFDLLRRTWHDSRKVAR